MIKKKWIAFACYLLSFTLPVLLLLPDWVTIRGDMGGSRRVTGLEGVWGVVVTLTNRFSEWHLLVVGVLVLAIVLRILHSSVGIYSVSLAFLVGIIYSSAVWVTVFSRLTKILEPLPAGVDVHFHQVYWWFPLVIVLSLGLHLIGNLIVSRSKSQ